MEGNYGDRYYGHARASVNSAIGMDQVQTGKAESPLVRALAEQCKVITDLRDGFDRLRQRLQHLVVEAPAPKGPNDGHAEPMRSPLVTQITQNNAAIYEMALDVRMLLERLEI